MKKFIALFVFVFAMAFAFSPAANAQMTLNGVTLPAELTFSEQSLELNGGGIRKKYFFSLYTAGLYLSQKSKDASSIMGADETMAIRLEITSSMINSGNMSEAITEGFENSTGGNTGPVQDRVDELLKAFSSESIEIGDVFDIVYIPGTGSQTYKNGSLKSTINGLDFKKALFGVWLSDKPASTDLKKGMLGR